MEEKIKEIVSKFIRIPPEQIGPATPVDRSAVQSSIHLHRMYARLAEEGIVLEDYSAIKAFGDLLLRTGGSLPLNTGTAGQPEEPPAIPTAGVPAALNSSAPVVPDPNGSGMPGIGIDVEETAAMPRTADFRTTGFYRMNFTPEEIAYCSLQPDAYASFAGLFAAKEAIVKAGGLRGGVPFNTIRITHSVDGKPLHAGLSLSISHTNGLAVAVVVRPGSEGLQQVSGHAPPAIAPASGGKHLVSMVAWLALLLGAIALMIALTRHT